MSNIIHPAQSSISGGTEPSCPAWCSGTHNIDNTSHTQDRGTWHYSAPTDRWIPADKGSEEITVRVVGFRHELGPQADWPDAVEAEGDLNPGFMTGASLEVTDARRLARAINAACDLLDGGRS